MAILLSEAAALAPTELAAGVLETFVESNPILDRLPLKGIPGNTFNYRKEATLPAVEFRAINAAYSESTGTVSAASEKLVILGGDADVDKFIADTLSGLNDQRAVQTRMKVKAASMKFSDAFFNGDSAVDANSFDGLKKRTTGGQILSMGTNGAPALGDGTANVDTFLDRLDELIDLAKLGDGGNGALYANDVVLTRLRQGARRKTLVTDGEAVFGNVTKRVAMYRGIPLLDPGANASGAKILPQTETAGSSTDTSSVYAVRFGEDESDQAVTGLFNSATPASDGVFDVRDLGELQAKPSLRTRVEGYVGVAQFGGKAVARLTGVRV